MTNLVMIPAFGCDERLYEAIAPLLPSNVLTSTIICDADSFETCVERKRRLRPIGYPPFAFTAEERVSS